MRIFFIALAGIIFCSSIILGQNNDSIKEKNWKFNAELNSNYTDLFFISPVITADKGWLHLESRYNYEELKTFSGWVGYNYSGGKKFTYNIVPMAGFLAGRLNGMAPGLELTFGFGEFELYTESEYVFDFDNKENNYFYDWTELSYSPLSWFNFGLSAQRTKVYQNDVALQHGVFVNGNYKTLGLSFYYYNPGEEEQLFILTLSAGF